MKKRCFAVVAWLLVLALIVPGIARAAEPAGEPWEDSDFAWRDFHTLSGLSNHGVNRLETERELRIPDHVQEVRFDSFKELPVEVLVFPKSLTIWGDGAFSGCRIRSISYPEGYKVSPYRSPENVLDHQVVIIHPEAMPFASPITVNGREIALSEFDNLEAVEGGYQLIDRTKPGQASFQTKIDRLSYSGTVTVYGDALSANDEVTEAQLAPIRASLSRMQVEIRALETAIADKEKNLAKTRKNIERIQGQIEKAKAAGKDIKDFEKMLAGEQRDAHRMQTQIDGFTAKITNRRARLEALEDTLHSKAAVCKEERETVATLQTEAAELKTKLAAMEERLQGMQREAVAARIVRGKEALTRLARPLQAVGNDALSTTYQALLAQAALWTEAGAVDPEALGTWEKDVQALAQEIDGQTTASLEELRQLRADLAQARLKITTLEKENAELRARLGEQEKAKTAAKGSVSPERSRSSRGAHGATSPARPHTEQKSTAPAEKPAPAASPDATTPKPTPTVRPLFSGYPDGCLHPDRAISRAEWTTLLDRLGHCKAQGEQATYPDIDPSHWAYAALDRAHAAGLLHGDAHGQLRPDAPLTRAECLAMLARLRALPAAPTNTLPWTDLASDHWAASALASAHQAGLVQGYPDGSLRPERPVSRAEAAVLLERALGQPMRPFVEGTYPDWTPDHWAYKSLAG